MTTINAYSVTLNLDASSYIRSSRLTKTETRQLTSIINQARSPLEKYQMRMRLLSSALAKGAIDQATFNRLQRDAKATMDGSSRSAGTLTTRIAAMASAYLSIQKARQFVTEGVQLSADAEQQKLAFEVMLKDAEAAEKFYASLQAFAAATPFSQREIIASAKSLVAFGFSTQEVNKQLVSLGNISSATGVPIGELSEIIGKMNVQGTIMSEDLNQLAGRGINVFSGLAEKLGTTTDQVKKFASEGKISFQDLNAVLTDLANNEFGGMMERQAETLAGKWSTFNDELDQTKKLLAEMFVIGSAENLSSGTGLLAQFREGLMNLPTSPGQWADWLLTGDTSKVKGAGRMLQESEAIKAEAEARLDLARRRKAKSEQIADIGKSSPADDLGAGLGMLSFQTQVSGLRAGLADFYGGLMNLPNAIVATQRATGMAAEPGGLAAALEKGGMESANAILKYQSDRSDWERESQKAQKETAAATKESASILGQLLPIFEESGAWGKIR